MNNLDYWQGQQAANWAYRRDLNAVHACTNEWIDYANKLKAQLNKAQAEAQDLRQRVLFEQASIAGLEYVIDALVHALKDLNPALSLLQDETRQRLKTQTALTFLEQHGYLYDQGASVFRKAK